MLKARISSDSFSSHLEYLREKNAHRDALSCICYIPFFPSSTFSSFILVEEEIKLTLLNTVSISFLPHLSYNVTEIEDIRHLFNSDCL